MKPFRLSRLITDLWDLKAVLLTKMNIAQQKEKCLNIQSTEKMFILNNHSTKSQLNNCDLRKQESNTITL